MLPKKTSLTIAVFGAMMLLLNLTKLARPFLIGEEKGARTQIRAASSMTEEQWAAVSRKLYGLED